MTNPPLSDDPSIPDDTELWRRIPHWHWKPDQDTGNRRISSAAFQDDPDGSPISVVIARDCVGGLPTLLAGHYGFGVAAVTAGAVRELGLGVVRYPDDSLPGHAHIIGRKTQSIERKLSRAARMIVDPTIPADG